MSVRSLRTVLPVFFLLACLRSSAVGGPVQAAKTSSPQQIPPAVETFQDALHARTLLEAKPTRSRTADEYLRVIAKFRSVYYAHPTSFKADDAVLAVAELYHALGSQFKQTKHLDHAAKAYLFLVQEYPASPFCSESLFMASEIYLLDLQDRQQAANLYRSLIERYPNSKRALKAKARLSDLQEQMRQARRSAAKPEPKIEAAQPNLQEAKTEVSKESPAAPEQASSKSAVSAPSQAAAPPSETAPEMPVLKSVGSPAVVRDIRFRQANGFFRLVVELDKEIDAIGNHLTDPPRVFLDLLNSHLPAELSSFNLALDSGHIKRVRAGQNSEKVARVVVEVEEGVKSKMNQLRAPDRIVLDLQTPSSSLPQSGRKPPPQGNAGRLLDDEIALGSPFAIDDRPVNNSNRQRSSPSDKGLIADKTVSPASGGTRANEKDTVSSTKPGLAAASTTSRSVGKADSPSDSKIARPLQDGSRSLTRILGLKIGRIAIDPGHGGHDTGTIGPSGLQEKDLVLDVSERLKKLLEDRLGGEVVLTRSEDRFVALEERTALANQSQADLFISIHANSSRNRRVNGVETYFLNFSSSADAEEVAARENASSQKTIFELQDLVQKIALKEKVEESREFAATVQRAMANRLQRESAVVRDRGVKQAPFIVLIGANMPSILAEISFMSNPAEEKLLKSASYRQKLAEALYQGIENYASNLSGVKTAQNLP
ncbi:MAG: N-acetylmuramoyl-L-alanine amidase [Acidobacteriota bacterium]